MVNVSMGYAPAYNHFVVNIARDNVSTEELAMWGRIDAFVQLDGMVSIVKSAMPPTPIATALRRVDQPKQVLENLSWQVYWKEAP